ncbi:hypothetical protein MNBD_NITROSPINAE01-677 [hydrothermal vent metagenome]|uniref:Outer membrane lipoprotein BamD-like domain-containing protein n=1 Tax=hydrothermal vent metagenome TaxID=652676 RepID=A0A3B1BWB8_9ZZZZ
MKHNLFSKIPANLAIVALFVSLVPFIAGCETAESKKDLALMQIQITSIEENVTAISKQMRLQADLIANMEQPQTSMMTMTGQMEEFNARAQMLADQMESLEQSFTEMTRSYRAESLERSAKMNLRLDRLEKELVALSIGTRALVGQSAGVSTTAPPEKKAVVSLVEPVKEKPAFSPDLPPDELYQKSYNAYLRGDFNKAIKGFGEYVERYPSTDLSDNAAYWVGESYYGKGDLPNAVKAMDKMAEKYPASNKTPLALLKTARTLLDQGDNEGSVDRFKKLIDNYATSDEAMQATDQLLSLGIQYPPLP